MPEHHIAVRNVKNLIDVVDGCRRNKDNPTSHQRSDAAWPVI